MKDLKLTLFNYRKKLSMDNEDVSYIITNHINICDDHSELYVYESLKNNLHIYQYDKSVSKLLESIQTDIDNNSLLYELRDLYKKVESMNQGMVYRHPMSVILDIMQEHTVEDMKSRILNELNIYSFVPPIKKFMLKYIENPLLKNNLTSEGGKAEKIYTIIEKVDDGNLAFVKDKWFLISEKNVEVTTLDRWIHDLDKLRTLNILSDVCKMTEIDEKLITFKLEENLNLSISTKNGQIFVNDEKMDNETTLENVFQSPIIPYMKRQMYPIIKETVDNIQKFVDLDIGVKLTNITNPYFESYILNYKDNIYAYNVDTRYGNSFYHYDSAVDIVNEMKNSMGYDLTYFFKNKFDKEVLMKRKIEDREKIVLEKLEEVNYNLDRLTVVNLEGSTTIKKAKKYLVSEQSKYNKELNILKKMKHKIVSSKEQV